MSLRERTRPGFGIIEPCLPRQRMLATTTWFVILLMFFLAPLSAKAQIPQNSGLTGNWLYTICGANDQRGQTICQMWISGFQAGIISSQKLAQTNKLKPASCIPNEVTADKTKSIIESFLKENPQYMQLSAETVAAYALVIAFPCR